MPLAHAKKGHGLFGLTIRQERKNLAKSSSSLTATKGLLLRLRQAKSADEFQKITWPDDPRLASYRIDLEAASAATHFNVADADESSLSFLNQQASGFYIQNLDCADFQRHWASDVVRVLEKAKPMYGQIVIQAEALELIIEHIAVPIFDKQRISHVRGWFSFSRDIAKGGVGFAWDRVSVIRRSLRSQALSMPARLSWPGRRHAALHRLVFQIRAFWKYSIWKHRALKHTPQGISRAS